MKTSLFLLLFLLLFAGAFAQQKQGNNKDSVGVVKKKDTVALAHDPAKDSLAKGHNGKINKDSIKADVKKKKHQLDSAKGRLTHKIDSLNKLHISTASYTHQLDSLNKINPLKDIQQEESKLTAPVQKVNADIKQAGGKLNNELSSINKETMPSSNLPAGTNLPGASIPGAQLPNAQLPGASLPNASLPNAQLPNASIPNAQLPNASIPNASLPNAQLPNAQLPNATSIPGADEIGKAEKEMGQVSQLTQKASGVESDIKDASKGDFEKTGKTLENEASAKVGSLDELKKGTSEMQGYEKMLKAGEDPEAMKKLAMEQAKKEVVNHFAGKEQQLQAAMNKVSQLKMKYPELKSLKDTLKRRPNAMHGKPLIERIVPGLTLQVLKVNNRTSVDFNPWIGYRFTGKITAGAGWNDRLGFGHHFGRRFGGRGSVYGPRTFVEYKWKKGFSFRGEIERMNTRVPPSLLPLGTTERRRTWVWGVFAGVKKDYKLYKSIKGNVQMLYNVYSLFQHNPTVNVYGDQLSIRIGFEFPMKKRVSKKTEPAK